MNTYSQLENNEFHGAEAVVKVNSNVIKERIKKSYRIKELDESIRKFRTKREAKILEKIIENIAKKATKTSHEKFTPKLIDKYDYKLVMETLPGRHIDKIITKSNYKKIADELGRKIKYLHDNSIIHGDLTTANILVNLLMNDKVGENKIDGEYNDGEHNIGAGNFNIYIIDFGLSFFSNKIEDKAVDIHVLKEVMESSFVFGKEFIKILLKSYDDKLVENRLKEVEKRGRNKTKGS